MASGGAANGLPFPASPHNNTPHQKRLQQGIGRAGLALLVIIKGVFFNDCRIEGFIGLTQHLFFPETFSDFARSDVFIS